MRRPILISIVLLAGLLQAQLFAQTEAADPHKLFYEAAASYEKGDYPKAAETYIKILDAGVESGNIYYNIGNAFLKMKRIGYAILCYEKAKRLILGDGDLKSNLEYAYSMLGWEDLRERPEIFLVRLIKRPFKDINLTGFTHFMAFFYCIVVAIAIVSIANPVLTRRFTIVFIAILAIFTMALAAYAMRFYDEEMRHHAIVIQNGADARYEPIDKSDVYYTVHEAQNVLILKTRSGWRQIKRSDGRIGWVKKEAVEEI